MISSFKRICSRQAPVGSVLEKGISIDQYCTLDLSVSNVAIADIDISDPKQCQTYIDQVLINNNAIVAYGGYLEKRNLYGGRPSFTKNGTARNIHLGLDFWTAAGTKVMAPLMGKVHSFQNNAKSGDYGPTIILSHEVEGVVFYSLYGHLSLHSIANLYVGQEFEKGTAIGTLGTPDINVNYAPHLHFQIILDMEGMQGDYPGVCSVDTLDFYAKNCPDPNLLLKM